MKAIYQSVNDRSKIKASLFNVKGLFRDIRSYEKMLSTPELAKDMNEGKTREKINSLINECVNELAGIEWLVKIYAELFMAEFYELQKALWRITDRQPLTKKLVPCNSTN